MTTKSQQFTREDTSDGAIETLSIVRLEGSGEILIQVEGGTPADHEQDYIGLYYLDGSQWQGVGTWELVLGDTFEAGDEATKIAEQLVENATAAGASVTISDYLARDGSLPFSAIVADWEHGQTRLSPWEEAA